MNRIKLQLLTDVYPLALQDGVGGIVLMGVPLGTPQLCSQFLWRKLAVVESALAIIASIQVGRLIYLVQRMTASVCRFARLMRLMPPDELASLAAEFDARQAH